MSAPYRVISHRSDGKLGADYFSGFEVACTVAHTIRERGRFAIVVRSSDEIVVDCRYPALIGMKAKNIEEYKEFTVPRRPRRPRPMHWMISPKGDKK